MKVLTWILGKDRPVVSAMDPSEVESVARRLDAAEQKLRRRRAYIEAERRSYQSRPS